MADVFVLVASFDKSEYTQGDLITLSVTGTVTSDSASVPLPVTVNIVAADGSKEPLSAASAVVTVGADQTWSIESVDDASGRVWTPVEPDKHSATAIA